MADGAEGRWPMAWLLTSRVCSAGHIGGHFWPIRGISHSPFNPTSVVAELPSTICHLP